MLLDRQGGDDTGRIQLPYVPDLRHDRVDTNDSLMGSADGLRMVSVNGADEICLWDMTEPERPRLVLGSHCRYGAGRPVVR